MSDPDRNADAEPRESSEPAVSSERRGADDDASATLPSPEASLRSVARASEPPTSGARKRSSIRPAPADWRPSTRAVSNPPRPMVVVYSGDRERPDRWWDESPALADSQSVEANTPVPPDPALSARELRPPPAARFSEDSNASAEDAPSAQQFSTIIPPAGSAADTSETEAPVALSSAARALPLSLQGAPRISEPPRLSDADLVHKKRERASLARRAAVIVVGAFLSAYFVTQRVAFHKNEAARARGEKTSQHVAEPAAALEPSVVNAATPETSARGDSAGSEVRLVDAPPPSVAEASPPASAAEAPQPPPSAADTAEEPPPAKPGSRTVLIEVVPWDAKVLLAGVAQPGPPFVVTIPQGKRIAFEVARRGFIPRRVVVDGSEPKLSVGLIRPRGSHVEPPPPPAARPETDAEDAAKDSRLRVRSGL